MDEILGALLAYFIDLVKAIFFFGIVMLMMTIGVYVIDVNEINRQFADGVAIDNLQYSSAYDLSIVSENESVIEYNIKRVIPQPFGDDINIDQDISVEKNN